MHPHISRRAVAAGLFVSPILPAAALSPSPLPGSGEHPLAADLWHTLPLPSTPVEAFRALPEPIRAELGGALVGMVLADLIGGQAYDEPDKFLDEGLRDRACNVSNVLLNHMCRRVEDVLPDLLGPNGDHPAWALNAGLVR